MTTKYQRKKSIIQKSKRHNDEPNSVSFFYPSDPVQAEREAQRQEFLRKEQEEAEDFREIKFLRSPYKKPQPKQTKPVSSKAYSLEENLDRTWAWLAKTFPHLFTQGEIKPLDFHILRDIKAHYKTYQAKRNYPIDLVIKAALYRYMEKPEYLLRLQEGTYRYDVNGSPVQTITKEEQEEAMQKLKGLKIL